MKHAYFFLILCTTLLISIPRSSCMDLEKKQALNLIGFFLDPDAPQKAKLELISNMLARKPLPDIHENPVNIEKNPQSFFHHYKLLKFYKEKNNSKFNGHEEEFDTLHTLLTKKIETDLKSLKKSNNNNNQFLELVDKNKIFTPKQKQLYEQLCCNKRIPHKQRNNKNCINRTAINSYVTIIALFFLYYLISIPSSLR